jgi:hypothetical protein
LVNSIKGNIDNEKKQIIGFIKKILGDKKIDLSEDLKKKILSQFEDFPETYWLSLPLRKEKGEEISLSDLKDYIDKETYQKFQKLWDFASKNGEHKPNIGFIYQVLYSVIERGFGGVKK